MTPTVAQILPNIAQRMLIQAAQKAADEADPMRRTIILEEAIQRVKLLYPTYFRQEH